MPVDLRNTFLSKGRKMSIYFSTLGYNVSKKVKRTHENIIMTLNKKEILESNHMFT